MNDKQKEEKRIYAKKYYKEHKEEKRIYGKKYYEEHKEKNREKDNLRKKVWRENNKEKVKEQRRVYMDSHKEEIKKYKQEHREEINKQKIERRKNDIGYRISCNIRSRLREYVKKNGNKTIDLIGCSINELKVYLEKSFKEGMCWDNYGISGWHIDHIKPCSSFNLILEEEQKKCFHYSNLQPLWAIENIRKSNK